MEIKIYQFGKRTVLLLLMMVSHHLAAQVPVRGQVLSQEDNLGIPGVNVLIKDTGVGTVTDIYGNYRIEAPETGAVLVFSSIGFQSQEIEVGNQEVINVTLESEVTAL